jgi:hypothetical protein
MTSTEERRSGHESWVARFAWGALPILVCLALLRLVREASPLGGFAICAACAVVLWFGWSSVRRNVVTKGAGVLLGLFFGLMLGLFVFGVVIRLTFVLLPVFLVALPLLVYDLLFRAPSEGQSDVAPDRTPKATR